MKPVSVFIADDHPVYREGLARHWDESGAITVVGATGDGSAVVSAVRDSRPDVAVIDLQLPGMHGLDIVEELGRTEIATRLLILTAHVDSATVYRAMAGGAHGYLEKAASFDEISQAVLAIHAGETVVGPQVGSALAAGIRSRGRDGARPVLSNREAGVLRLAADGLSAQQIGRELGISLATVKTHFAHIYAKLDVSDRAAAVAYAIRRGMLE